MNRFLAIATLLLAGTAAAQVTRSTEAQALTRAAPTVASFTVASGSTTGVSIDLNDVIGFRVSICAESGQTLSGAGALNAYLLDEVDKLVKRNPGIDLTISVTATSCSGSACRCQVFPDQRVTGSNAGGRLIYATNAVTVSGGTTATVKIIAWKARR